jgi:hypothetical protein
MPEDEVEQLPAELLPQPAAAITKTSPIDQIPISTMIHSPLCDL